MNKLIIKAVAVLTALASVAALASCGKNEEKKNMLYAKLYRVTESSMTAQDYRDDPEYFIGRIAQAVGMDEATANDFLKNESWQAFKMNVELLNKADAEYTFSDLKLDENPIGDIYILTQSPDGDMSLASGVRENYTYLLLCDTAKVSNNDILTALSEADMKITYYKTPADDEDDPDESDMKQLEVKKALYGVDEGELTGEEVTAKFSKIEDGSEFLEAMKSNEIAFSNEAKLFGLDADTAPYVVASNSEWVCYVLYIKVKNNVNTDLTFYSVEAENNGENGVWASSVSQYGEFSLAANDEQEMPVTVLVDPSKTGGVAAEDAVTQLQLSLVYSFMPVIDAEGQESIEARNTVPVGR